MFSVAIIGPDGAGKTTIGRRLEQLLPFPVKYLYMGVSRGSSNHLLPTTRLIEVVKRSYLAARPAEAEMRGIEQCRRRYSRNGARRTILGFRRSFSLVNQIAEEWFRQCLAWYYELRGYIVIFDRHFYFDYYSRDAARNNQDQSLISLGRLFILDRFYPKPDLVIYLDAPADVLFRRKGEGTTVELEKKRQAFLQMREKVRNFFVLDAKQPEADVARAATDLINDFYLARAGIKAQDNRNA